MHTTGNLTTGKQSRNGLVVGVTNSRVGVDLQTTHSVVQDRGLTRELFWSLMSSHLLTHHERDVEVVVHLPFATVEELN